MVRRTGFHAVLDLLPSLSRGELLNAAFRVAGLTGPLIEAPQELLLQTKARMQQVLRDRPLAEWGEALAPFVAEAKQQGFLGAAGGHPVAEGLYVLFNFPKDGFTKTRDPRLDPPVRVPGVLERRFGLSPSCPERWPEKPPQDWERFFYVDIAVKDAAGAEFDVRVPYKRVAENRDWAKALDLNVTQFCASKALWYYDGPTYSNEHLQFALTGEEAERNQALLAQRGEKEEAMLVGNFEAADRSPAARGARASDR